MKYYVGRLIIGRWPEIEISEDEYINLVRAKEGVFYSFEIEVLLHIIILNYRQIEDCRLSYQNEALIHSYLSESEILEQLIDLNRLLSNLLASCRAYLDQGPHLCKLINKISGDLNLKFSGYASAEYDSEFGYKLMYHLRNFAQHFNPPIHTYTRNMTVTEVLDEGFIVSSSALYLDSERFKSDSKMKKFVGDYASELNGQIDLIPHMRQFVSCLWHIQHQIRGEMAGVFKAWSELLISTVETYYQKVKHDNMGDVDVFIKNSSEKIKERKSIYPGMIERRNMLYRKNKFTGTLVRAYTTGQESKYLKR